VLRSACEFSSRRLAVQVSTVSALEHQLTEAQASSDEQVLTRIALGLICCACKQVHHAIRYYEQCTQQIGDHPELALEIGKLLLQSPQPELAFPFLKTALQDDKTRAAAHVFLAQLYGKRGELTNALEHLESAHKMTPAWGDILSMLAEVHQQLGNQQHAQTLQKHYESQRAETAKLAQQLSDHG
jgi:lipopolysaccharide biosynthesis regulator YciM